MGSVPALNVPLLLCQEWFNEASLPDSILGESFDRPSESGPRKNLINVEGLGQGADAYLTKLGKDISFFLGCTENFFGFFCLEIRDFRSKFVPGLPYQPIHQKEDPRQKLRCSPMHWEIGTLLGT